MNGYCSDQIDKVTKAGADAAQVIVQSKLTTFSNEYEADPTMNTDGWNKLHDAFDYLQCIIDGFEPFGCNPEEV